MSQDEQLSNLLFSCESDDNDVQNDVTDSILCKYICSEQTSGILQQANSAGNFSVYSHNVQSLHSKHQKLAQLMSDLDCNFSVISIQEVWSMGRDLGIPGYHDPIFNTRDMNKNILSPNCGGGVALFVNENLNFLKLSFENEFVPTIYESVWALVTLSKNNSVIVGSVYRPGANNLISTNTALDYHCSIINQIKNDQKLKNCKIFITGDYNLDLIKYNSDPNVSNYVDSLSSLGLLPYIVRPTRICTTAVGTSASLLDHVFSSSHTVKFGGIILNDMSDHFPVFVIDELKCAKTRNADHYKSDTSDENINQLCSYLKNVDWSQVLNDPNHVSATDSFFKILEEATDFCFPPKLVKSKTKKNKRLSSLVYPRPCKMFEK